MNLLFITPKYYYGGAELQMRRLIREGINLGYNITLLDIETKEKIEEDNLKIIQLREIFLYEKYNKFIRILKRIRIYVKIVKKIKENNYDYIIFFNLNFLPIVLFFKNKKIVYSVREYNSIIFTFICKIFLNKLYLIFSNNIPSYIFLKSKFKNTYLQNNIVENDFNDTLEKIQKKTYLIVSNISERKNILPAVETFKKLKKKGYKLKIAGKIVDKNYYEKIQIIIENCENIFFLGYLNSYELEKEYKKASGIIHLSKLEGTPNAILDSIKYNKKFICLNTPENICLFSEIKDFFISSEKELEEKILFLEDKDCKKDLEYLQMKIKRLFSIKNAEYFYKILKERL